MEMKREPVIEIKPSRHQLFAVVLKLTPAAAVTVRATMGDQAHAAVLDMIRQADSELGAALHSPRARLRPFTVSPLRGTPPARDGLLHLSPGQEVWLRVTWLAAPLYERFMARFLHPGTRPTLRLGSAVLQIHELVTSPEGHPWAGYASWADLTTRARPRPELHLHFATPTAFSFGQRPWGKKVVLLPEPALVFRGLIRTWNRLAPPELALDDQALQSYLEEHVVIKRLYDLHTRMLRFRRSPQVGFVGTVTYGLMKEDQVLRAQLNALTDLAFFAGVGMKTTMGMGQVRRLDFNGAGARGQRGGPGTSRR